MNATVDNPVVLLIHYRRTVRELILSTLSSDPKDRARVREIPVFDEENGQFMLVLVGWYGQVPVHHCPIHVEIADGKIVLLRDETGRNLKKQLLAAGVRPGDLLDKTTPAPYGQPGSQPA
jgi:hypothetical protein